MVGDCLEDAPTIEEHHRLLRRVHPSHYIFDDNLNRHPPTSAAFRDHPDGSPMSVHFAEVLAECGLAEITVLDGYEGFLLASITAALARFHGQGIRRTPIEGDPAHGEVFGKKTESVRTAFAKAAIWVVPPSTDSPGPN